MKYADKHYYVIEIMYLGHRYHGWSKQPQGKTIHGMVDKSLFYMLGHENFKTIVASRTDAMVSANQNAFELMVDQEIDMETFLKNFNYHLPQDISAITIKKTDTKYQIISQDENRSKTYQYYFCFGEKPHPFVSPFMAYIREELDIQKMMDAANLFCGEHNFKNYCYRPKNEDKNFSRIIFKSNIEINKSLTANFFPEKSYILEVNGNGFMHHQIRLMMGALIKIGKNELTIDQVEKSLSDPHTPIQLMIAPAAGLHLKQMTF